MLKKCKCGERLIASQRSDGICEASGVRAEMRINDSKFAARWLGFLESVDRFFEYCDGPEPSDESAA